jgi:hypothetical protein
MRGGAMEGGREARVAGLLWRGGRFGGVGSCCIEPCVAIKGRGDLESCLRTMLLPSSDEMSCDARGTVIYPQAPVKLFITADPAIRAYRRHLELSSSDAGPTLEQVMQDMQERDLRDTTRAGAA